MPIWRFIPACAGNSSVDAPPATRTAVHPRVCGEQPTQLFERQKDIGSSPRVRGTGHRVHQNLSRFRFIPACAGNRVVVLSNIGRFPVHPRVCGEQFVV